MQHVYVKLHQRERGSKYRKMLSSETLLYPDFSRTVTSSSSYTAGANLDDGEWFYISDASRQEYAIDIMGMQFDSVDFNSLTREEFSQIDFLFAVIDNDLFFQNISKTKLVSKKHILCLGGNFEYQDDCNDIVINALPDAIYHKESDTLYFRKLESITAIFRGIDQLYREATDGETEQFLNSDFITLRDNYSASNVKTANRKRIALAQKTLNELNEDEKQNIFVYIGEYCPNLRTADNTFEIGNEDELKMLVFGIEQRFYTTPVRGEKRIANSVIKLS